MTATSGSDPLRATDHPSKAGAAQPAPTLARWPGDDLDATAAYPPSRGGAPGGDRNAPPAPAKLSVPGYEILSVLGRGGMGIVYKARHRALNRTVALKMVLAGGQAAPEELARFRLEAEAVARLQHPNIVQVFEVGACGEYPYCALEFVEGGSLAGKIDGKPMPAREAAKLVEALARAVQLAHSRNVVHRDLKPANVLLAADGTPKIADFGLARYLDRDSGETQAGAVMGTPWYMAPEQAAGHTHEAGPPADVYALGAILYACLTGRPPVEGKSIIEALDQVRTREPVPPSRWQTGLPADLETICLKCLRKEPERRYASAAELADDLKRYQNGEPIHARPVGRAERVGKWIRRNKAVAALLASLALLLLLVAAGSSLIALHLRATLAESEGNRRRAERAEQEKTDKLWQSLLDQAQANRWSGRSGRRFRSLSALKEAAHIRPALDLRNEAIAWLARTDLRVPEDKWWPGNPLGTAALLFDTDLARYARSDESGSISVRRVEDDRELVRLPGFGAPAIPHFVPGGRLLAAYHRHPHYEIWLWSLERGEAVLKIPDGAVAWDFAADGRLLVLAHPGAIACYEAASGKQLHRWPCGPRPYRLAIAPDGRSVAVSSLDDRSVRIRNLQSGKEEVSLPHPAGVRGLAWHPEGSLLATACEHRVYVWDVRTPRQPMTTLQGQGMAVLVAFSRGGDLLASTSWDGNLRLWSPWTGKLLASSPGATVPLSFSADDRRLAWCNVGPRVGLWQVDAGSAFRTFKSPGGASVWAVDFSPDDRLLASAGSDGVHLWDLAARKRVAFLPVLDSRSALWHPDGKKLITSGVRGLSCWPIQPALGRPGAGVKIGPPQPLGQLEGAVLERSCLSRDGRLLAVSHRGRGQAVVVDLEQGGHRILAGEHLGIAFIAISPEGRWVAAGTWQGRGVKVWDVRSGRLTRELPARESANVAFSPDGKWLVTGAAEEYRIYRAGSWELCHRLERESAILWGPIAFSPDGLLAISSSEGVHLIDPATAEQIATLPAGGGCLGFNHDGSQLAGEWAGVWDLRRIRQELTELNLDWDLPQYPPANPSIAPQPLRVEVVLAGAEPPR